MLDNSGYHFVSSKFSYKLPTLLTKKHSNILYESLSFLSNLKNLVSYRGRIHDFKLGGAHLKKLRRAEGGAKIVGVFRVKNHDFKPKNYIFFQFKGRGVCACRVRPSWIRPWQHNWVNLITHLGVVALFSSNL